MKKGTLYKISRKFHLHKTEFCNNSDEIAFIKTPSIVVYLEQSLKQPFTYKVIVGDQIGWTVMFEQWFEELKEHHAEPKEQA